MPTVKRFDRCRIEMYFDDHPPPHFHVAARDGRRAVVLLESLTVSVGDADPRDIQEALDWAQAHRDELTRKWDELSGAKP